MGQKGLPHSLNASTIEGGNLLVSHKAKGSITAGLPILRTNKTGFYLEWLLIHSLFGLYSRLFFVSTGLFHPSGICGARYF